MLGLDILVDSIMTKRTLHGMYSHYVKRERHTGYKDEHFNICLKLMTQYDISEKLGLSFEQLMNMDPDSIKRIEDHMIEFSAKTSQIVNNMTNGTNKEFANATNRRKNK